MLDYFDPGIPLYRKYTEAVDHLNIYGALNGSGPMLCQNDGGDSL